MWFPQSHKEHEAVLNLGEWISESALLTYVYTVLPPNVFSEGPLPVYHVLLGTSSYKSGICISNTIHLPSPRSANTSQLVIWKLRSSQESCTWNPTHHFVFTACYPLLNWAFWTSVSFTVCVSLPSWLPPAKWCLRCPLQCVFQN